MRRWATVSTSSFKCGVLHVSKEFVEHWVAALSLLQMGMDVESCMRARRKSFCAAPLR